MKPMGRLRKSHGRAQRHRKEKPLTPAMGRAIELTRANGGRLPRDPSGQWWGNGGCAKNATIQALVDRGLALYTDFRETEVGQFARDPTEVTLTAKAAEV